MTWEFVPFAPGELSVSCRQAWHSMSGTVEGQGPLCSEDWFQAWLHGFNPVQPIYLCAFKDHQLAGLAPVQETIECVLNRKFRVLRSLANVWSFRYEFPGSTEATTQLLTFLLKSSRWDAVCLEKIAEDSTMFSAVNAVSAEQGWQLEIEPQICSPYRLLPSQKDGWGAGLKSKFKRNLRSRSRRLASEGNVDFRVVRSVDEKAEALEAFYALESSGWKGQQGTAICQVPEARVLFDELVKNEPSCWLPVLSLNGQPIAAQIVQTTDSHLYLLKTAYDAEYSTFSPGQLITARVMAYCVEQSMEVFDFLGDTMSWKMDWEPELRQHYRLSLYAPSLRGRMARWRDYKFRRTVKRLPGAVSVARWIRQAKGRS